MEIKVTHLEDKIEALEKQVDNMEGRLSRTEQVVNELDKSLSISMKQIESIAENLRQTSVNFKEAVMRSNTANAKDTEILKDKIKEQDAKIEKIQEKLEQETIGKDAESWRSSKKQIWSWILNAILGIVAVALGISKFM
jgi:chromosome segregation ATPase